MLTSRYLFGHVENVIAAIMDLTPNRTTDDQRALAAGLSAELTALRTTAANLNISEWWLAIAEALERLANTGDPMRFIRWAPIRTNMFYGTTFATIALWWQLRRSPAWQSTWAPLLRHRYALGHPPPFPLMPSTNAKAIENAFHLFSFEATTGLDFHDADCVVEFGGGFGSMCRMIHERGFRGTYIIFDLPHSLALQRFYLGLHGIGTDSGVHLCSDLDQLTALLDAGNFTNVSAISTWAMSEMPISLRDRIQAIMTRDCCRKLLLGYQARFEGVDNLAFFAAFAERTRPDITWSDVPMRPVSGTPRDDDNFYLFGVRAPPLP